MGDGYPRGEGSNGIFAFERYGDRIAIRCDDGRVLTYAQLANAADEEVVAFGPDRTLVMIEASNALPPLLAYLGAMRAGHVVMLVSGETDADRIAHLVALYRPGAGYRKDHEGWRPWSPASDPPVLHPDLSLLLSTSGSTGTAKLVRLARSAVEANAASIATYLAIGPDDRAITTLPFHYSYGLSVVHSHLLAGATLLLTDQSVIEAGFHEFAVEQGATSIAGVPYTYELLERSEFRAKPPSSLRTMTQAGGRLPPDMVRSYAEWGEKEGVRFFVMYGQTEATARMAYMPVGQVADYPDHIGIAIPGGAFQLLDTDKTEIVEPDTVGELVYRGPNVMMGYALEAADLARPAELETLTTGDLAERNEVGLYRIVGRLSRFIKPFGVRIGLDDVEAMFRARGLSAAATGDDHLLVVVVMAPDGEASGDDEADRLSAALNLPLSAIHLSFVDQIPRLSNGKPDYVAIRSAARRSHQQATGGQDDIRGLFESAFPRGTVTEDASFVTLGGDSLNYVRLSIGLERILGRLPARWEELTVAELKRLLPEAPLPKRRWWQTRGVESEVVIRALAIIAVVVNHASDRLAVGGGAHVLMMLFGYNLSRYQLARLGQGDRATVLRDFGLRIILPYYILLLAWTAAKRDIDVPSLLLVSNFGGRFGSLLEPYWFLEALWQVMLLVTTLMLIPSLRRLLVERPWSSGVVLLAGSLALAMTLNATMPRPELQYRTPELLFWLVALGWAMHRAGRVPGRIALLTLAVVMILMVGLFHPMGLELGYPDGRTQRIWFAASCFLILIVPRLNLPAILVASIAAIASASFHIYLTHIVPIHVLRYILHVKIDVVLIVVAVLFGVGVSQAVERSQRQRSLRGEDA